MNRVFDREKMHKAEKPVDINESPEFGPERKNRRAGGMPLDGKEAE